jgi:hypothetical protein
VSEYKESDDVIDEMEEEKNDDVMSEEEAEAEAVE